MDHADLVRRATGGDVSAFIDLTRRYQNFAFGSALAHLRDFQQAEDVTQEALIAAWSGLPTLAEPAAFPGWLRGIVRHHASRVVRRRRMPTAPLSEAEDMAADEPLPDHVLEQRRQAQAALAALSELPKTLREPATLFFIHDCSHLDVAAFLGLSPATVNNRIHAARSQLKRRILTMTDTLHKQALPDEFANRIGRLIEARGHMIEALFDPAALPDLLSELVVSDEAGKRGVPIQVVQRLGGGKVRGLTLNPVAHLPRGATVLNPQRRSKAPVNQLQLEQVLPLLTAASKRRTAADAIVETGIKVIDVMCPILAGGTVALAGEPGAGTTVVMEEIVRRISKGPHPVTMLVLLSPPSEIWPPAMDDNYSISRALREEGYSEGTVGAVQTFFVGGEPAWTEEKLARLSPVDTVIHLSRDMILRKNYPGVDVRTSRSRLLDEGRATGGDAELARRIRDLIRARRDAEVDPATAIDRELAERAARLQAFFSQPFLVAEPFTKRPGSTVSRASALRTCREILDGLHDDLTAADFYFMGSIEEIRAAAGRA